jgi:hypothetical protein
MLKKIKDYFFWQSVNIGLRVIETMIYRTRNFNGHAERVHNFRDLLEDGPQPFPIIAPFWARALLDEDGPRMHVWVKGWSKAKVEE